MKNMNQFEDEQEFDQDDLSATELTAGPDNLLDDDLEGEDIGAIDSDYESDDLDSEDDLLDDEEDMGSDKADNMDDDPDFTGRDDS